MKRIILCTAILIALDSHTASAKEGMIQCANLIYGGTRTSRCFSDEFLSAVQRDTTIATERRFKSVKMATDELFNYPFVMITGETDFRFTSRERANLEKYLASGGFLLASAGCSNKDWARAFRREMRALFGRDSLQKIPMDHPIFRTVHEIETLELQHPAPDAQLEGIQSGGKLVVVYSAHGLNDTKHTEGCCCCGGNEITNALQVNVNILVYALMY
ncbi:MAG: DUF4159 domain-containing protein [Candidatus Marinimicrobia bacterium]|nr:DUF4159 domain-containing protein [Candidatus Neomarinimicrobiota bacterium]